MISFSKTLLIVSPTQNRTLRLVVLWSCTFLFLFPSSNLYCNVEGLERGWEQATTGVLRT